MTNRPGSSTSDSRTAEKNEVIERRSSVPKAQEGRAAGGEAGSERSSARLAAGALLLLGLWGAAAPYAGRALDLVVNTTATVEVVDHVVPGAVILAVAVFALVTARISLPAALLAALASFWMTATHVPLLLQVPKDQVGLAPALWHSLPGMAVFVVALAATVMAWRAAGESSREDV